MDAAIQIELLKFLNRKIRIRNDLTHQEYDVVGINWDINSIIFSTKYGLSEVHYNRAIIVEEESEDE